MCQIIQFLSVWDDVSDIVMIVLDMRLLRWPMWITVEDVCADLTGLGVDLKKAVLFKLGASIGVILNSG